MERARGQCEFRGETKLGSGFAQRTITWRCPMLDTKEHPLHAHLMSYGAVGKIKAERIKVLCYHHHMLVESELRPQNRGRLGRAS